MDALLLVGTRKGLFLLRPDDQLAGPILPGWSVFHAIRDPRDESLQVAANNFVYGGTFQRSEDGGETWARAEGLGLPEDSGLKLEETWHVELSLAGSGIRHEPGDSLGIVPRNDPALVRLGTPGVRVWCRGPRA
jgi:hypothetical protein